MAAQIVHAAGESILSQLPENTNAVVLEVESERYLLHIASKLQLYGVAHRLIREVDPPYTNQFTAIGLVPLKDRTIIKNILGKLKLLTGDQEGNDLCLSASPPPCLVSETVSSQE